MKRFTTATAVFGVSILVVWAIFQLFAISQNSSTAASAGPPQNELLKILNQGNEVAIPAPSVDARMVAPVFDANGTVISDPTGTMLNAGTLELFSVPVTGSGLKVAPVFDASGAVVSDPSGTILNAGPADVKIAPVFDVNGKVVSDPAGTLLNSPNP